MIRVGTAGWSLPTEWQEHFPEGDTHLHRYARVLDAVEINRTFRKLPRADADGRPGGFGGLAYFRLHGDPRTYYSAYRPGAEEDHGEEGEPEVGLEAWAERLREAEDAADEVWCVFDNTAAAEGTGDALAMQRLVGSGEHG